MKPTKFRVASGMLILVVALMYSACTKKVEETGSTGKSGNVEKGTTEEGPSQVQQNDQEKTISKDEYDKWRKKHALIVECDDQTAIRSEKRHNIIDPAYFNYLAGRHVMNHAGGVLTGAYTEQYYSFQWKTVIDFMNSKEIYCYDGWLKLDYDADLPEKIRLSRSEYFSNNEIMYPRPMFDGILYRIRTETGRDADEPSEISFIHAICPVKQAGVYKDLPKIIFRIKYKDTLNKDKYLYYDMSDDPT